MRLPLRICRRTGILGGTKGAPLMKNSVPFYRSQSAILRTVHGAYTASGCAEGSGSSSPLRRPGLAGPAVAKLDVRMMTISSPLPASDAVITRQPFHPCA